jgi:drug/metabolite transporter (DMT)-like permease
MTGPNRLAYAALVAVCIIWGTTYLVIRVAVQSIPPSLMGGFRWIIAGTLLLLFVRLRGEALPRPHEWRSLAIQGLLMIGFGNGFVNWAEQYVPSGLAAVVIATCPFFMTGIEALRSDGERISRRALTGLGLGFAGILVLVWPDLHLDGGNGMSFVLGLLALQGACLGWALGSSYSKRHPHGESVIGATGLQMVFGGLVLMLAGTIAGEWQRLAWDSRGVEAMTYLIVVGSIGGFVSYIYALRFLPVSTVSIYAYINPLIAVILGALLLDEQFGIRTLVSMAIVFAGVSLVKAKPMPATSERAPMSHAGARRATTAG